MIQTAHFLNFKALRSVDIEFERFTLIVGPNASGKTSILEGIDLISRFGANSPESVLQERCSPDSICSHEQAMFAISARGNWHDFEGGVHFTANKSSGSRSADSEWSLDFETQIGREAREAVKPFDYGSALRRLTSNKGMLLNAIASSVLLKLEPSALSKPSYSEEPNTNIESTGAKLASALADMKLDRVQDFQSLEEAAKCIIPALTEIRLTKSRIEDAVFEQVEGRDVYKVINTYHSGYRIVLDYISGTGLSAELASEGTLIVLGILTCLWSDSRPRLILIDELERGLHPRGLKLLIENIRKILNRFPECQIIATTHSPYLLDHFSPAEIRITTLDAEGHTKVGRLDSHPDFDKWKDEMKPGEFWSTVGEDWLLRKSNGEHG